jgi:hypothetical protein
MAITLNFESRSFGEFFGKLRVGFKEVFSIAYAKIR